MFLVIKVACKYTSLHPGSGHESKWGSLSARLVGSADARGERGRRFPRRICSEQYREDTQAVDARLYEFVALSPRPPRAPGCSHLRPSECTSADPASSFTKFVSSQLCKDSYVSCQLRPSQCVGARSSDPSQLRMRVLTPRRSSSRVATWTSGIIGSQRKLHPVICCLLNWLDVAPSVLKNNYAHQKASGVKYIFSGYTFSAASCCGFFLVFGCGVSFLVDSRIIIVFFFFLIYGCSATSCDFDDFVRSGELTSFYSTILLVLLELFSNHPL